MPNYDVMTCRFEGDTVAIEFMSDFVQFFSASSRDDKSKLRGCLVSPFSIKLRPKLNTKMKIETSSHILSQPTMNAAENVSAASHLRWSIEVASRYKIIPNVAYSPVPGNDSRLDVYQPSDVGMSRPTLMYIHGGGWTGGSNKESVTLSLLPFIQLDWTVLNVEYRRSDVSPAPAAVQDCLHALRWVGRNASQYDIDLTQLVVAGMSAGGHLALTTAMIPIYFSAARNDIAEESGILTTDLLADIRDLPTPAAVINWCGITDVADLLSPPNLRDWAVQWLGNQTNQMHLAKWVSPMTYVRQGLPPVVTVHGDKDLVVPYEHGVRLHQALSEVGVRNQFITLPGSGHGFGLSEKLEAYRLLLGFLRQMGIRIASPWKFDKGL